MSDYVIKDSGHRRQFETGAQRDRGENKPRYDLVPPLALRRIAMVYTRGAEKYDARNWERGMPLSEFLASMMRHVEAFRMGEKTEDHLGAVCFNAMAIMHFQELGILDLDDLENTFIPGDVLARIFGEQPAAA